jgi:hypothetical protein
MESIDRLPMSTDTDPTCAVRSTHPLAPSLEGEGEFGCRADFKCISYDRSVSMLDATIFGGACICTIGTIGFPVDLMGTREVLACLSRVQ